MDLELAIVWLAADNNGRNPEGASAPIFEDPSARVRDDGQTNAAIFLAKARWFEFSLEPPRNLLFAARGVGTTEISHCCTIYFSFNRLDILSIVGGCAEYLVQPSLAASKGQKCPPPAGKRRRK